MIYKTLYMTKSYLPLGGFPAVHLKEYTSDEVKFDKDKLQNKKAI